MTPSDQYELLARLAEGQKDLLSSVQGLSDAEAAASPGEDRWSAIGNIEHLAIVETNMVRRIREAATVEGEPQAGREASIFDQVRFRTSKRQAPPQAQPTGECASLDEALSKFQQARNRTLEFLQSNERDLRLCTIQHPAFGAVTGLEAIYMIAAHPFRHAAQIREFRGAKD